MACNANACPLSFQTEYYWSDEMNETLAKNVTVAMASQTALRSNPVYTQVTMIIIQGLIQVVILNTIVKWLFLATFTRSLSVCLCLLNTRTP